MSVLAFVSFVVIATALLAFALLGLMVHDELKFQRQFRAANDSRIEPVARPRPVPAPAAGLPPLPKAA
jgi:hypothetical protein